MVEAEILVIILFALSDSYETGVTALFLHVSFQEGHGSFILEYGQHIFLMMNLSRRNSRTLM